MDTALEIERSYFESLPKKQLIRDVKPPKTVFEMVYLVIGSGIHRYESQASKRFHEWIQVLGQCQV